MENTVTYKICAQCGLWVKDGKSDKCQHEKAWKPDAMTLCTCCSAWSPKEFWSDNKCPFCHAVLRVAG